MNGDDVSAALQVDRAFEYVRRFIGSGVQLKRSHHVLAPRGGYEGSVVTLRRAHLSSEDAVADRRVEQEEREHVRICSSSR